jgi:regulatory LuxR family protein
LGIADLAAAGVRAERPLQARTLLERALAQAAQAPGPRLEQLTARACGLLADPGGAEGFFGKALADPAGDAWPFERAQLRLDYGEWLRRQRRINDAKPVLAAALDTFRRLGAAPWTRRAEAELRACGVTTQAAPTVPGGLAELTAQQREIVILASRGLTNGEIADQLFLSPRTVASHRRGAQWFGWVGTSEVGLGGLAEGRHQAAGRSSGCLDVLCHAAQLVGQLGQRS